MAKDCRRCVIIPAAGLGNRFVEKGYVDPKPFILINNVPMIEMVARNLRSIVGDCRVLVVMREAMRARAEAINDKNIEFTYVEKLTQGAASTVLHALENVNDDDEIIIANSDQLVDLEPMDFKCESQGTIVTFQCLERDPKWSYADVDDAGYVTRVAEKVAISDHATAGIYHFATSKLLRDGINNMVKANDRTNEEFYLCPVYNHLSYDEARTRIVEARHMWGLGTPEDFEASTNNEEFKTFVHKLLSY